MPEVVKLAQSMPKNQLKVQFLPSRWFENVEGQFDIIVGNPPILMKLMNIFYKVTCVSSLVRHWWRAKNGLTDLRHLIEYAPVHLKITAIYC